MFKRQHIRNHIFAGFQLERDLVQERFSQRESFQVLKLFEGSIGNGRIKMVVMVVKVW